MPLRASRDIAWIEYYSVQEAEVSRCHKKEEKEIKYKDDSCGAMPSVAIVGLRSEKIVRCLGVNIGT